MVRYERLGRVDLNVTNLDRSGRFYEDLVGLQRADKQAIDGSLKFLCGTDNCEVVLHESPTPGFRSMALALQGEEAFETLRARLEERSVACQVVPDDECLSREWLRAWRIGEPNTGATLEFYLPHAARSWQSFVPGVAKIERIGHVVFTTPRYGETTAFMTQVLEFAASDDIEGVISFMRPPPNPYHHGVGVARGERHGLHHLNFMVAEIDDIGIALNRFRRHHVPVVFGPGRHIASNSVFLYFLDPDGLTLEYSFGMEEFPETEARAPRTLPPRPESIDSWGGRPDPKLAAVGDVQFYRPGTAEST